MEVSPYRGLPELAMDDFSFIHQWMNSIDELSAIPMAAAFADNLQQSISHPTPTLKTSRETTHMAGIGRPAKQLKTNSWGSCITDHASTPQAISSPNILSFANSNHTNQIGMVMPKEEAVSSKNSATIPTTHVLKPLGSFENQNYVLKACHGGKRVISTSTRNSQTQDHIIAERMRREKLSQRFIALSAIVPGLKKTDKASVLGDAIKYLKHLQEQVKTLEEQTRKRTVESVVFVKKSQLFADGGDNNSSIDEDFSGSTFDEPLPEIEARSSDKDVLIRIHCEKKKGVIEKIVDDIEKLHLTVVNSSVVTFGSSMLDVTIIAQMDTEFCMTLKDLVKVLRYAFLKFM